MSRRISTTDALRARLRSTVADLRPTRSLKSGFSGSAPRLQPITLPGPIGGPGFADRALGGDILNGRWSFGGQVMDVGTGGHPFSVALPSERFADWVHSFAWLPDLLNVEGGAERAGVLISDWLGIFDGRTPFVFAPDITARRMFYWGWTLSAIPRNGDRLAQSYAVQMRTLKSAGNDLDEGLPRLIARTAEVIYAARLSEGQSGLLARTLDALDAQLAIQILPDGGHISRAPMAAYRSLLCLHVTDQILAARGVSASKALGRALDRLAPMVATLTHTDGALAVFHGGAEGDARRVQSLLGAVRSDASAFGVATHSGYHRVESGGTRIIVDAGRIAPRPYDRDAHLAPLAFEMSTPEGRLIVNCGWNAGAAPDWRRPVRAAAAHSTLILEDSSPGRLLEPGWKTDALGDAVAVGPGDVRVRRKEQPTGVWLETSHDGYRPTRGLVHRRRFFVGEDGDDIRGEDSLFIPVGDTPLTREQLPFAVRFHFHPDVRVSLAQDLSSALLVQDGRAGWRFRTDGGPLSVEPSVYLGAQARPQRAQQIVISGRAFGDGDGQGRDNRVRWSLRRLRSRNETPEARA